MTDRKRAAAVAVLATAVFLTVALIPVCVQESDGAASKGTHIKVTPEWVTESTGVITDSSGTSLCRVTVLWTENDDGSVTQVVNYRATSSGGHNKYLEMKNYNEPDDPTSTSFFYISQKAEYNTSGEYKQLPTSNTCKRAETFKADFYLLSDPSASPPTHAKISGTTTLTLECDLTEKTMYDYVTEISYDINYGTNAPEVTQDTRSSESVLGTIEMTVSDSTDMTREGYTFKGWSKSLDGSDLISPGETVTVNAGESNTLYAIWVEDVVYLNLIDDHGGYQRIEARAVRKGTIPSLPSYPTTASEDIPGLTFIGWFKDEGLTEPWDNSPAVEYITVLYAGWQPDLYFTTDPVADCKVTKTSYQTYIFDATVSKDFATSAKSVSWTVVKDGETVHESIGPYMTYQFLEDGEYDVTVKLVNSYGVKSEHTEHVTIDTSERPGPTTGLIVMIVMAVLVVAVVARMLL